MTRPDILVRKATLDDLKNIQEVCEVVNQAYGPKGGWTSESFIEGDRMTEQDMVNCIKENGNPYTLLFAMEADTIVGTIQVQPSEKVAHEAEFRLFSVSPFHQSKGIGGKLLKSALEEMKATNKTHCVIRVFENRPELLNWYKKLGFVETGDRIPYPWPERLQTPNLDFLVMKKPLDD